jgi:hypothetical protein
MSAAIRCGECERRESNPHTFRYWNLNPARLPVPPLSHTKDSCECSKRRDGSAAAEGADWGVTLVVTRRVLRANGRGCLLQRHFEGANWPRQVRGECPVALFLGRQWLSAE